MVSVLELLDREWARLGVDHRAARRLPEVCAAAGGAGSLAAVERFVRSADPPAADAVLVALAARAVEADALAARVLLQLLLPGARRLARTWWALGEPDERAAAAVAAVYDRIRRYPLARRPRRVAANVLMDAAADLRRAARAGARASGLRVGSPHASDAGGADGWSPGGWAAEGRATCAWATGGRVADGGVADGWGTDGGGADAAGWAPGSWPAGRAGRPAGREPVARDPEHPAVELAAVLAEAVAAGVVTAADAELIAASRIAGVPLAEIAERRGAKLRTLQWRRRRAEETLSAAASRVVAA